MCLSTLAPIALLHLVGLPEEVFDLLADLRHVQPDMVFKDMIEAAREVLYATLVRYLHMHTRTPHLYLDAALGYGLQGND